MEEKAEDEPLLSWWMMILIVVVVVIIAVVVLMMSGGKRGGPEQMAPMDKEKDDAAVAPGPPVMAEPARDEAETLPPAGRVSP